MGKKKIILLKLTGQVIGHNDGGLDLNLLASIAQQIKELKDTHNFSIVIGGGNFYRGNNSSSKKVKVTIQWGHSIGMLATIINGLIVQDIFEQQEIKTRVFSAIECPQMVQSINAHSIKKAISAGDCLIFAGGTGNPFFTTDTTAVCRALQINAIELWKGTKVDGVYNKDPKKFNDAHKIDKLTYEYAIEQKLAIMDLAAFAMAQENNISIRVFNIFEENALIQAANDMSFGSIVNN